MTRLVLASSSRYRRALLARLGIEFDVVSPDIDESERPGEDPRALAARLAGSKARVVAGTCPGTDFLVIGSDQVAARDGRILRKPGDHATALAQLLDCRDTQVTFFTALHMIAGDGRSWTHTDRTVVRFLHRSEAELDRYLRLEEPYDCAGGFKAEGLGIVLFDGIDSTDPTALVGLPLIALSRMLSEAGLDPLRPLSAG